MKKKFFIITLIFINNIQCDQLKWGMISTSRFAQNIMIKTIQNSPRSIIKAISSRDIKKSQEIAKKFGIEIAYGSYDELINDPNIDIIYIDLPNSMHAEWTIKAVLAGKHVLCEKPLALTTKDVSKIIIAAKKTNVIVVEAFQYLYHPQTDKIVELIFNGKIGDIKLIKSTFSLTTRIEKSNIRMQKELGGGSMWDQGCYQVSLVNFIMKKIPDSVFMQQLINSQMNVDIINTGILKFKNVLAQFDIGLQLPFRESVEIIGTKARLIIDDPWRPGRNGKSSIRISDSINTDEIIEFDACNPYKYEILTMESYILDKKQPLISLEESKNCTLILEALAKSAQNNKVIPVHQPQLTFSQ